MTYSDQLKSPKWQKKRLEILERDEFMCQYCGDTESKLNVHHFIYIKGKDIWDYDDIFLITFCDDCHNKWHEIKNEIDKLLCVTHDYLGEYLKFLTITSCDNPYELQLINDMVKIRNKIKYGVEDNI